MKEDSKRISTIVEVHPDLRVKTTFVCMRMYACERLYACVYVCASLWRDWGLKCLLEGMENVMWSKTTYSYSLKSLVGRLKLCANYVLFSIPELSISVMSFLDNYNAQTYIKCITCLFL